MLHLIAKMWKLHIPKSVLLMAILCQGLQSPSWAFWQFWRENWEIRAGTEVISGDSALIWNLNESSLNIIFISHLCKRNSEISLILCNELMFIIHIEYFLGLFPISLMILVLNFIYILSHTRYFIMNWKKQNPMKWKQLELAIWKNASKPLIFKNINFAPPLKSPVHCGGENVCTIHFQKFNIEKVINEERKSLILKFPHLWHWKSDCTWFSLEEQTKIFSGS